MALRDKPFDQIGRADIDRLIADGERESRSLDYKQDAPKASDDGKKEFCFDVSSFANGIGGDILLGINERKDATGNTGEPETAVGLAGVNFDAEQLRLESILRGMIQPRIPSVQFRKIDGDNGLAEVLGPLLRL